MREPTETYRCRQCGATSYGRLTHRDADGAMTYSGTFRCSGCRLTFNSLAEWRKGIQSATATATATGPREPGVDAAELSTRAGERATHPRPNEAE